MMTLFICSLFCKLLCSNISISISLPMIFDLRLQLEALTLVLSVRVALESNQHSPALPRSQNLTKAASHLVKFGCHTTAPLLPPDQQSARRFALPWQRSPAFLMSQSFVFKTTLWVYLHCFVILSYSLPYQSPDLGWNKNWPISFWKWMFLLN